MFRDAGSREAAERLSSVSAASRPLSTQQSGTAKATTSVHVTCDLSGRLAAPLSHALDVLEEIWFTCLLAAIGGRALDDSKRRVLTVLMFAGCSKASSNAAHKWPVYVIACSQEELA